LAEKHKDRSTLSDSWKFPTKGASPVNGGTQNMHYHQALMGIIAGSDGYEMVDEEMFDENI
jgi:hypothetical protein